MVCESWKAKLDTYLDGEVPEQEMRTFDSHVRNCPSCSADALSRVQLKRAIQVAGKRFTPSAEFRKRMQQNMAPKARRSFRLGWMLAAAAAVVLVAGTLTSTYLGNRSGQRPGVQRDCRLARGDASQFVAGRCDLDRPAHGKALVPGKDSLRLQFAGTPE